MKFVLGYKTCVYGFHLRSVHTLYSDGVKAINNGFHLV